MRLFKRLFSRGKPCDASPVLRPIAVKSREQVEEEKWEEGRWEETRYLVTQERRSVVLGKLKEKRKKKERKGREVAEGTVSEMRTVNYSEHGREAED